MRKAIVFFCAFIFIVSSFSCNDDNTPDLNGIWNVIYVDSKNCDQPDENQLIDLVNGPCIIELGIEICIEITYEFKENGDLILKSKIEGLGIVEDNTETFAYSIDGNIISACSDTGCDSIQFDLNGDELIMEWTSDEDGCEYLVRALKI